jgi:hypothetical protein
MNPPAVKPIQDVAFYNCSQLTTVNGGEGLEEIGNKAFGRCISLQRLDITSNLKAGSQA